MLDLSKETPYLSIVLQIERLLRNYPVILIPRRNLRVVVDFRPIANPS